MNASLPLVAFAVTRPFLARRFDTMAEQKSRARYLAAIVASGGGACLAALACCVPAPVEVETNDQTVVQEIAEGPADGGSAVISLQAVIDDTSVTVMPIMEFLDKVAQRPELRAAIDTSALAGVPDEVLERLRTTAILLQVSERDGKPTVLMREIAMRGREQLRRIEEIENARTR